MWVLWSAIADTSLLFFQAEQEVQNLMRKLKLLENDLDQAEDKAADSTSKLRELETLHEESERENKQLNRKIELLEGMPM